MNPLKTFLFPSKTSPIIQNLMTQSQWRQSDEEEKWAQDAIESLIKKIKKKPNALETLLRAIETHDPNTPCVTMPRSLDGRLQVAHRKGLPHVIYCRVWRWPDVMSHHELEPLPNCRAPFNASPKGISADCDVEVCINPMHYRRKEYQVVPPVLVPRQPQFDPTMSMLPNLFGRKDLVTSAHQFPPPPDQTEGGMSRPPGLLAPPVSPSQASQFSDFSDIGSPMSLSQVTEGNSPGTSRRQAAGGSANSAMIDSSNWTPVHYTEPENWCSIAYYEMNNRIGEIFKAKSVHVIIDGYTNPTNQGAPGDGNSVDRFSLGLLNHVGRNPQVEQCRQAIGRGVHLYNIGGQVYAEVLSESAVFVQSRLANMENSFNSTAVLKCPAGSSVKIFSNQYFAQVLARTAQRGYEGYKEVFQLGELCTIRMSLVKGWGADYSRNDVTATPCWIEIQLNGALDLLDRVLRQMDPPTHPISSRS